MCVDSYDAHDGSGNGSIHPCLPTLAVPAADATPVLVMTADPLPIHVHVPTPGDHYSAATGSAIMTLVYEMARAHAGRGGRTRVLVARGTRHDYPIGECVEVEPTAPPKRWQKLVDAGLGRVGLGRPFGVASYGPASAAVEAAFEGPVFVHNNPVGVPLFARRLPRAKVCLWANNELFGTYARHEVQRIAAAAHLLICCSKYIAEDLCGRLGTQHEKIKVVRNGADVERFRPDPAMRVGDEPVILFVGRIVPVKGVDLLLRAAARISNSARRFKVRIVGSSGFSAGEPLSPYEQELRSLAGPIQDRVEFRPFVDRDRVVEEYQSASIFCGPSNWDDPCPLTIAEAMACGLAVVASARGGIPEVGGDALLYFNPPDVDALAAHLARLVDHAAFREESGRCARQRAVQHLTWDMEYAKLKEMLVATHPVT
jgi:glycosyltransferase involved in cell wall biosynthesis